MPVAAEAAFNHLKQDAVQPQESPYPYPFREQTAEYAEYAENKRWNPAFSTRPRSLNSEGANWLSMAATAAISFSDSSAYSPYSAVELIRLRLLWPQNFLSDFVSVGF